ncbi:LytTR family DNA-binding domain-containing protein [Aestuariibacter halophilus]|uniref:LytTR family DNA-binding domain-containing protein n=1 Tax=Fluctibacter halophilus TaxID=226011 RepID=A0ABS8GBD0_9ALTE|nr:LytTR family DNA-binding domain-containing protein [Aestuariibacter halophilus]MCC2617885.1 LytTR family DNA-binding domain-containing protein [Aestuariibacter halophilus]
MLKVLVADDEPIARNIIVMLLEQDGEVSDIREARDGNEALQLANDWQPDIIFLDIQMPGQTGLQLAEKLPPDSVVVFVTAYDEFAVNAFDLCAVDYLLKPFEDERFRVALSKAREQLSHRTQHHENLQVLLQYAMSERRQSYKSRLVVKEPGRIRLIDVSNINYIAGAGNYAEVHLLDDGMILHRETLSSLERQLDPDVFVRIHRSSIVRRDSICELRPNIKGDYEVILKSGDSLTLSRRNKDRLADMLR